HDMVEFDRRYCAKRNRPFREPALRGIRRGYGWIIQALRRRSIHPDHIELCDALKIVGDADFLRRVKEVPAHRGSWYRRDMCWVADKLEGLLRAGRLRANRDPGKLLTIDATVTARRPAKGSGGTAA